MNTTPDVILQLPESVRQDVLGYRAQTQKFLRGEINTVSFRAYRVPMGIYEQRTSGRFMVRVRVGAGLVLPAQLRKIAELSRLHGGGVVHVTTRQDLQVHDVPIEKTPDVLEGLLEAGLAARGGGGNTVRNISACPRCGTCPNECFNVGPHAIAAAEFLLQFKNSFNLPRKFKVAFSGCPRDCAQASVTDLGFFAHVENGAPGFAVYAGGGLGGSPRAGVCIEPFIPAARIFETAEAVKRVFDQHGDRTNKHKARLRFVLDRLGKTKFAALCRKERVALAEQGLPGSIPPIRDLAARFFPADQAAGRPADEPQPRSGVRADKQAGRFTLRVPLALGDLTADQLDRVADVAARFGVGLVRTTQLQDLQIPGLPGAKVDEALAALGDLRPKSDGAHLKIVTCTGAATCKLGICLSRNLTTAIESFLREEKTEIKPGSPVVRISGCPNSCGNHFIAAIGLEGRVKRHQGRLLPCYRVMVGGRFREGDARLARSLGTVPARRVPALLARLLAAPDPCEKTAEAWVGEAGKISGELPADYYQDFGTDQPFSLAGRGPGECGAGVLDVVRLDLEEARDARGRARSAATPRERSEAVAQAVVAACRALLVVFGLECKKEREIFRAFQEKLVGPGWVRAETAALLDAVMDWRLGDRPALDDLVEAADQLVARIGELFHSLDSNLQFTVKPFHAAAASPEPVPAEPRLLDLRGVKCPMNFVKAKVALEKIGRDEVMEILLDDGEPVKNVPASFADQGQEVVRVASKGDHFQVSIRRKK